MRIRHAFTLVELLVVIGIIALLVGILMPALSRARANATAVACQANIKQVTTAAIMYGNDHKVYVGFAPGIDRKMLLYPYLRQGKSNLDMDDRQVWHCPANDRKEFQCGYGFNTNLNWVKLTKIRKWTETVALCDAGLRDSNVETTSTMVNPPSKTGPAANPAYRPNARHPNKTCAVGFVDSHVEMHPLREPFYPGPVGAWAGNDITDPTNASYKDQLWDLQ